MNVGRIYTRNLVTVPRSGSLQQAATLMRSNHVGALLVTGEGTFSDRAVGIITDRDLAVQAMAEGVSPAGCAVGKFMTDSLATVSESADVHEAIEIMRAEGIRRLAVTGSDGEILGVLSFDDVVDAIAVELSSLAQALKTEWFREAETLGEIAEQVEH
jgi:CBS domain-containing protein